MGEEQQCHPLKAANDGLSIATATESYPSGIGGATIAIVWHAPVMRTAQPAPHATMPLLRQCLATINPRSWA